MKNLIKISIKKIEKNSDIITGLYKV